jgi:hypothetical protein
VQKNVLCEKGDEITRFDGKYQLLKYLSTSTEKYSKDDFLAAVGFEYVSKPPVPFPTLSLLFVSLCSK